MTNEPEADLTEVGLSADESTVLDGLMDSRRQSAVYKAEVEAEELVNRMAANMVRRMCDQHVCQGTHETPCEDPRHARDVDYLRHCLAFLGLSKGLSKPTKEERKHLLANLPSVLPLGTNKP